MLVVHRVAGPLHLLVRLPLAQLDGEAAVLLRAAGRGVRGGADTRPPPGAVVMAAAPCCARGSPPRCHGNARPAPPLTGSVTSVSVSVSVTVPLLQPPPATVASAMAPRPQLPGGKVSAAHLPSRSPSPGRRPAPPRGAQGRRVASRLAPPASSRRCSPAPGAATFPHPPSLPATLLPASGHGPAPNGVPRGGHFRRTGRAAHAWAAPTLGHVTAMGCLQCSGPGPGPSARPDGKVRAWEC